MIVSTENESSSNVTQTKSFFTLCSFSAAKLIHFISILKQSKTFRCCSFTIILNLSSHIVFSLQFASNPAFLHYKLKEDQNLSSFLVYFFLSIPTKSRTFATEIKQIVIENIRKTIKKSSLTRGKTWEIKEEYSNLKDNAIWKKQFISPRCMGRAMTTSM